MIFSAAVGRKSIAIVRRLTTNQLTNVAFFPLSSVREDNFVAGPSMRGYGALKLAFTLPEQFAAAASLSGVTDVTEWGDNGDEDFQLVFGKGGPKPGSQHDLFELATSLASSGRPKPRLYQCCGTEDPLYAQNIRFRDAVQDLGFDYLYEEGPGEHSWDYWTKRSPGSLLGLSKAAKALSSEFRQRAAGLPQD